jgi:hypothetical protein
MLHSEAPVRIHVSVERSASILRMIRIGELGTTLGVTSNRRIDYTVFFAACVGC